ncbi:MAG: lysophospholipid acyltransferase family protein [Bacteroidales bacterium]|nr:lysophospholipid acyltransferase family protein [Bacteroidales bacterium]
MENRRSLGARLLCGWMRIHGCLPLPFHRFWARIIAFLVEKVFRYRRDVVMVNLSRSFPGKSYKEITAICHRFYLHLATILTESIWSGGRRGAKGRERLRRSHIVEFSNPGEFNRLMALSGQVMLLSSHTGNWELLTGMLNYSYGEKLDLEPSGFKIAYLKLTDAISEEVMAFNRMAFLEDLCSDVFVESFDVMRYIAAHREPGMAFLMVTDQYPYGGKHNVDVEFMHRTTPTMTAAAYMAVKYGMAAAYLRLEYREDGGYRITVVPLCEHAAGEDPAEIMQRYYRLLEKDLEAQPWNYLWTHRRWKTEDRR